MKLSVFLLLLALMKVSAEGYAQRITLSERNAHLESVLHKVRKQSGYFFLYQTQMLKETPRVDIDLKNASLEEALEAIFRAQPLTYTISRGIVVIQRKKAAAVQLADTLGGRVTDTAGVPLPGVSVMVKGRTQGTATGVDGAYLLQDVPDDGVLVFSLLGFATQEIPVAGRETIDIVMQVEESELNEVVVVGYGTQLRANITGSVATVRSEDLTRSPLPSSANALAGRLPGLISHQSSGRPGGDAASLSIRGFGNALVIVDGIETDFRFIDPNQIESITILKDASASIYGSRAGNGVILVTTKRGVDSKPVFAINTSQTWQGITDMPRPVSSGQFAELSREAHLQAGNPEDTAPFTEEQVQNYHAESDPYLFPNTDWYSYLIRDWTPMQQHNLSVRGGTEQIKYYGFLGFMDQQTLFKKGGGGYQRYNFQSNVDASLLDNFDMQLTIASINEMRKYPHESLESGESSAWGRLWNTHPIYPAELPDPSKVPFADGNGTGGAHVTSNRNISGYNDTESQQLLASLTLNYRLKAVKGLSFKLFGNYSKAYSENKQFKIPVSLYTYDPAADQYILAGSYESQAQLTIRNDKNQMLTGQASIHYENTIGEDHRLSVLALYELIDQKSNWTSTGRRNYLTPAIDQLFAGSTDAMSNDGRASEMGRQSYVSRLNYSYRNKYLLEGIFRADASAKFPPGQRWGYFPGISLGWRFSEESFMNTLPMVSDAKLRISYGQAGNDAIGNFQYLSGYQLELWPYILGSTPQPGLVSSGLPNPNMTWERIKTYNAGLDLFLYNGRVYGEFDIFYRQREGILATRSTTLPSSFGASLPPENINSLNDRGYEIRVGTLGSTETLRWDISANLSWSRSKWDHYEEPEYSDPDQIRLNKRSGQWTDRQIGYISDGLFTSQEEIDALAYEYPNGNSSLRPGDLRIRDMNEDGVLDWRDQTEIGQGTVPHTMLGLNVDLRYRNFDFSALFQGAVGFYKYLSYAQGDVYTRFVYENRWTPENNDPNALIPRLGGAGSNNYTIDRRYQKADYLRLKSLSLGYTLPVPVSSKIGLQKVRIYLAGINLLTFSGLNKYNLDPESPNNLAGRYYPQQRTLSVGANISL